MKVSAKIEILLVLCVGILVAGFLFAGRTWDKAYTDSLTKLTAPNTSTLTADGKDYEAIARAKNDATIEIFARDFRRTALILLSCAAAFLAALYFVLMILINAPLNSISLALAREDTAYIKDLIGKEDEFGRIAGLVDKFFRQKQSLLTEITERKQLDKTLTGKMKELEEAYERLQEMQVKAVQSEKLAALGRFASGVAHEVKDPLAILLGGMEYVKAKLPAADPELREALGRMSEAVMRTDIVVKDLLTFAKPSKSIVEAVHPNMLINDAIISLDLFRHRSDTADISIKQELTDKDISVEVDKNQIQQAVFSILLNAIEAISLKGDIIVKTYPSTAAIPPDPKDRAVCIIEIKDTGVGIPKEDIEKIFEPFFTTKRDKKGAGLGLSVVKSIVDKNKGVINIQSEINEGTTVRIMLPEACALRRI